MLKGLKRAKKGFAFQLATLFALGGARRSYRGATPRRRVRYAEHAARTGNKLVRRLERVGPGAGRLTARHGTPYNDRETLMRLRAMENGAHVELHRDSVTGKIIKRHVVWPKTSKAA